MAPEVSGGRRRQLDAGCIEREPGRASRLLARPLPAFAAQAAALAAAAIHGGYSSLSGRRQLGARSARSPEAPHGRRAGIRGAIRARTVILLAVLAGLLASGCVRVPKVVVLTDPLSAEEHVMLGVGYEQQGEFFLAEREYARALKQDPRCFQARFNLGNVALAQREYQAARKQFLKALDIRTGDPEATNNLAMTAILSKDRKWMADARARIEALLADPANRIPALLETKSELDAAMAPSRESK